MLDVLPGARLDPWAGDAPLILTESRSLAGVLRRLVDDYAVLIAATNGQVGGFLHTEIIPILRPRRQILSTFPERGSMSTQLFSATNFISGEGKCDESERAITARFEKLAAI
jgi:hypothetical protein